jgi:FkbM family methyltransferase
MGKYAVVYYHGKPHYLGRYGSEESKIAYSRLIAEIQANPIAVSLSSEEKRLTGCRPSEIFNMKVGEIAKDAAPGLWHYVRQKHKTERYIGKKVIPLGKAAQELITLDSFVERHDIKRVDFIKADIEGAERNMLRGAQRILREFAPKLSICTYHLPDDPEVIREIIMKANPKYKIVEKFSKMYAYIP